MRGYCLEGEDDFDWEIMGSDLESSEDVTRLELFVRAFFCGWSMVKQHKMSKEISSAWPTPATEPVFSTFVLRWCFHVVFANMKQ